MAGKATVRKIMIVAGEASGDMHAAKVVESLLRKDGRLKVFGLGGPLMAKAGMEVREDLTRNPIMGLLEVARHLPASWSRLRRCRQWLATEKPDLLFLVDYPTFNLNLAQIARELQVPVCYYIAPKVWASREGRLEAMKRTLQKLLIIFPFEKAYFQKKGLPATYVGNPLLEEMDLKPVQRAPILKKHGLPSRAFPLICAMPGSRKGEVAKIWPLYLETARLLRRTYPDLSLVVPQPHGMNPSDYPGLTPEDPFFFVEAPAYDVRKLCDVSWVKSGTSTLETALLASPMIMVYKMIPLSAYVARKLIKIKEYSLPNILSGGGVVPELIQERATSAHLLEQTRLLLENPKARSRQLKAFQKIKKSLSRPPRASENAAHEILEMLAQPR